MQIYTHLPQQTIRYFLLFIALTIIDGLQTMCVVEAFGAHAEVNPIMRMTLVGESFAGLWWIKAVSVLVLACALPRIRPRILLGVVLIMACIVASNLAQILLVAKIW